MATTYVKYFGLDWPREFRRSMAALTVAKKWRLLEAKGIKADTNPGDCLEEGIHTLLPSVKFNAWAQQMVHDIATYERYAMIGCGACGKSHIMSACGIAYWLVDPFDTAVVIGSATLKDLSTRAWAPTLQLFTELKNNPEGLPIPGKIVNNAYAIVNERDVTLAETVAARASIQGRALDEGRIQGLHVPWVMVVVDELALVRDIEALKTSITNVSIGTLGFKFISAANPDPWESPNSCFYIPPKGTKVDEDTGEWSSAMGYRVRHFDGLKSPVVLKPELKEDFPFLISKQDVQNALDTCSGDPYHPRFYKMVRGFPRPTSSGTPTILDPLIAVANKCAEPLEEPMSGRRIRHGLATGVDPAWSEGGDDAVYSGVEVVIQDGRPYLNFSNRVSEIKLSVKSPLPITQQLRNGVIDRLNKDGGPKLSSVYVDSSGNQGLADDLDLFVGPGCGHINASERASERPLRALDPTPGRLRVRDRGAEAWVVLAEFCRAGMVRGLPQEAVDGLTQRRFMCKGKSNEPVTPLRLEAKEEFITRFKGSPNKTDGCALAALAVKEQLGVIPYGMTPAPVAQAVVPGAYEEFGGAKPPDLPGREYTDGDFGDIELHDGD